MLIKTVHIVDTKAGLNLLFERKPLSQLPLARPPPVPGQESQDPRREKQVEEEET
jgi:hypothetical protein